MTSHHIIEIKEAVNNKDNNILDEDEASEVDETYAESDNYASNYNTCLKVYKTYSINKEKKKTIYMFGNRILLLPHTIGFYIFLLIIIFILSAILRHRTLLYFALCPIVFYFFLTILNFFIFFYNLRILRTRKPENFIHESSLDRKFLKLNLNQINESNLLINENSLDKHIECIKKKFQSYDDDNLIIIFYNDYYLKNIKSKTLAYCFIHFLNNFLGGCLCVILIRIV